MNIGAHVSIAGGVFNAPANAAKIGCECFQMFTRSPQGGPAPELNAETILSFKQAIKSNKQKDYYIHTPYYINLASSNNRIRYGSISVIRSELERGSLLGAKALMTHLGSSKDLGAKEALKNVIEGLKKILDGYKGATRFLIENSAGAGGTIIGDEFQEIGKIIKALPQYKIGVCFDTCHAYVSGYDLSSKKAVEETFHKFDKEIGLECLALVHANDTKSELNSHKDRHEHIGFGNIGQEGFRSMMHHQAFKNVDFILETPPSASQEINDIKMLKNLRK
ncbi:MAG: deoxyribonuclease IV [Patescibacteria group bacterium]|jgi:deoxyribonuclease-4